MAAADRSRFLSLSSSKTKWIINRSSPGRRSLSLVTTPHSSPIHSSCCPCNGTAVLASGFHLHEQTSARKAAQGLPIRRNEENSMASDSWNWCMWSKANENDFFKSSQCSCREFSHLIYMPFESVTHTSYTDASHHPSLLKN